MLPLPRQAGEPVLHLRPAGLQLAGKVVPLCLQAGEGGVHLLLGLCLLGDLRWVKLIIMLLPQSIR